VKLFCPDRGFHAGGFCGGRVGTIKFSLTCDLLRLTLAHVTWTKDESRVLTITDR